jgi:hypothetical protein
MWTSPGSQPTTLVVSRTSASSSSAMTATTYGGSKPGSDGCELIVYPATTPRPDTGVGSDLRLRQRGQIGTGG